MLIRMLVLEDTEAFVSCIFIFTFFFFFGSLISYLLHLFDAREDKI